MKLTGIHLFVILLFVNSTYYYFTLRKKHLDQNIKAI